MLILNNILNVIFISSRYFILSSLLFGYIVIVNAMDNNRDASQTVMIQIKPIAILKVSGNPEAFIINDYRTNQVEDNGTRYSLVTNIDNMKVIASIDNDMPAGTKLFVKLNSNNANSLGYVDISNSGTAVELLNGIKRGCEVEQSINYLFSAEYHVNSIPQQTRKITLTLTN